jgi:hypothetical protein
VYAAFALDRQPGGLAFAKLRAGDFKFAGRVADASATLFSNLKRTDALAKKPLTTEQLSEWKSYIEHLARDFVSGRADVDPREYPGTCERCGLHAVCRIHENRSQSESEDEETVPAYE